MATHEMRFVPFVEGSAGFRAFLSERISLSLGVGIGWALVRYDLGLTTDNGQTANLLQTPRLNVTPGLGLGLRFM